MDYGTKKKKYPNNLSKEDMDEIFIKYKPFILIYIDDIIFSKNIDDHYEYSYVLFIEFFKNGLIIRKEKK